MKTNIKRFFSIILDFLSFILVWFLLSSLYSVIFITNNSVYQNNTDTISSCLVQTNLYEIKDGNTVQVDDDLNRRFVIFYTDNKYLDTYDKYSSFDESKKNSGLFEYSTSELYYVEKEGIEKEELTYFYSKEFKKLEVCLYNTNQEFKVALDYNQNVTTVGSFVTIIISSLLIYFVMPLILKKGQSLFYKIFKLVIISEDDKDPSFGQLFIHAWANTFIILLGFKFYFISFLIVFLVFVIDKKHRTLGDFASVTKCEELVEYEKKRR